MIAHLSFLFGDITWEEGQYICLRGIGEKGTSQEGAFREEFFFEPHGIMPSDWMGAIIQHCRRWSQHNVASFIIPCVLSAPKATAKNCATFTTVAVDFDSGDTNARLQFAADNFGEPDFVVTSGGTTSDGFPKYHAWWKIEPTSDIEGVVNLRHEMAEKAGGDMMLGRGVKSNPLGRAHQPMRIAGTVHNKNNHPSPVAIVLGGNRSRPSHGFKEIHNAVSMSHTAPWMIGLQTELSDANEQLKKKRPPSDEALAPIITPNPPIANRSMFSPSSSSQVVFEPVDLTTDVHSGGEDKTRFSEFNRVAGHYIHTVRVGQSTLDEALGMLAGWVSAHMVPAWPEGRVQREWEGLVRQDIASKGPFIAPMKSLSAPVVQTQTNPFNIKDLREWSAANWITPDVPRHTELVEGLILKGEPHLFVAEGGSGKTFMVADLALKVAAWEEGDDLDWCGLKIKAGGTAILILCEDSKTEMHIRLRSLGGTGLIEKAGERLIVLPMTVLGGAFPLTERDPKTGGSVTSSRWNTMLELMRKLPVPPSLVAIDTLNSVSHGDENSNVVIAEMMREAHKVCGEFGAALLVNHHIRKSNDPLRSLEDLKNAIRGASAIPSYFRINFGLFHASDYERRMRAMGMFPKRGVMWKFGICKANIHGLMQGERTLIRGENGLLQDVTKMDAFAAINISERIAWLVFSVKFAADKLHPYAVGGKNDANGLYRRRTELPPALKSVGWKEFGALIDEALQKGYLSACAVRGSKAKKYLDVPEGVLASDDAGVVIAAGSYKDAPDWSQYYFEPETGEIILKHKAATWNGSFSDKKMDPDTTEQNERSHAKFDARRAAANDVDPDEDDDSGPF